MNIVITKPAEIKSEDRAKFCLLNALTENLLDLAMNEQSYFEIILKFDTIYLMKNARVKFYIPRKLANLRMGGRR